MNKVQVTNMDHIRRYEATNYYNIGGNPEVLRSVRVSEIQRMQSYINVNRRHIEHFSQDDSITLFT